MGHSYEVCQKPSPGLSVNARCRRCRHGRWGSSQSAVHDGALGHRRPLPADGRKSLDDAATPGTGGAKAEGTSVEDKDEDDDHHDDAVDDDDGGGGDSGGDDEDGDDGGDYDYDDDDGGGGDGDGDGGGDDDDDNSI